MNTTHILSKSLPGLFPRHLSTLPKLPKVPSKYKPQAIQEAQKALTEYLHGTRSLPFTSAEYISNNSLHSLSNAISTLDFSAPNFYKSLQRFFRYHPINEFEFFFESIGIDYGQVGTFLPANSFFFSEDGSVLDAACALSGLGFPWDKLGILYKEERVIFSMSSAELRSRLCGFKDNYGFGNVTIVGICLAFPYVLSGKDELSGDVGVLFDDLKTILLDFDLESCVEGNVDAWYEVCTKIKVFYDLMRCEKGIVGELMGNSKHIFLDYTYEVLVQRVEYFCRFGVRKEDVGLLLLQSPEVLNIDLETPVISVVGLLTQFGMSAEELNSVAEMYPHALGRNKMVNLPHVMKVMDRQEWFFDKIKNGNHQLLANYALSNPDEGEDQEFKNSLEKIQISKTRLHTLNKLKFLHHIGFGENALTIDVLNHLHGTRSELQGRFDCLLWKGIGFSKLCMLIRTKPKILNQKPEKLEQKVNFLCQEMGVSLQYLDVFPTFLCFDLESRIKPRYKFHMWLTEMGLGNGRSYSIASMVATSEKNFVARLYGIHPAAPKLWFECFSNKKA